MRPTLLLLPLLGTYPGKRSKRGLALSAPPPLALMTSPGLGAAYLWVRIPPARGEYANRPTLQLRGEHTSASPPDCIKLVGFQEVFVSLNRRKFLSSFANLYVRQHTYAAIMHTLKNMSNAHGMHVASQKKEKVLSIHFFKSSTLQLCYPQPGTNQK